MNWLHQKYHLCRQQVPATSKKSSLITLSLSRTAAARRGHRESCRPGESLLFASSMLDCLRAFPNQLFLQHWIMPDYGLDAIDRQGGRGRTAVAHAVSSGLWLSLLTCPFGFCNTRVWILAVSFALAVHQTALIAFPYPLRGQTNPIITLLVIPFIPHAFWSPFPVASVHFSRSGARAGPCLALYIWTGQLKQSFLSQHQSFLPWAPWL